MLEPNFSPFTEIKTERLLLRCLKKSDAPTLLFLRSDETVMQYIDREKPKTLDEAEGFVLIVLETLEKNEGIMWAICLKNEPEKLIGTIGYWRFLNQHYRAEVGYMLNPNQWNKGIMKEALLAVVDFGFKVIKLHSIEAHINPENIASGILLKKAGFTREAYFKEDFYFRGKFINTAVYSLLNKS